MRDLTFSEVQFYGDGLLRWLRSEEMVLSALASKGKVYKLLVALYESPLHESIDSDFNGMSFDSLCRFLNFDIS